MKQIYHFSDQLSSVDCIPCPEKNHSERYSRDHIPTKTLLNSPYPENLMDVGMCRECNSGFARDEEYFAAFLASVISGSTEPDPLQFPTASRILAHNARLRSRIDGARRVQVTPGKDTVVTWTPELERIERVIGKNARGHILFELGQAITLSPNYVHIVPIEQLSPQQLSKFEYPQGSAGWPLTLQSLTSSFCCLSNFSSGLSFIRSTSPHIWHPPNIKPTMIARTRHPVKGGGKVDHVGVSTA